MVKKALSRSMLLKISLTANAIFILLLVACGVGAIILNNSDLEIAEYNALRSELCGDDYPTYLQKWGESNGEDGKKVFAATVCLRDYKTGNELNLEPLITP